ncbi:MAG TPA: enoyl-CoA hydratase-related protein [Caulobacterales bacterium]|nr:enoyl-CoA hydratase-related protein [Caulobacterales bacterium]
MSTPFASYEKTGRIARVTLSRPESRNAVARLEDCRDVVDAVTRANDDPEVNVMILTGAGAAFSSGGDLRTLRDRSGIGPQRAGGPAETRATYRRGVQSMIRAFADAEIATIAAINGPAIGLGLDLALICDMRVCARSARLASSFLKVGIIPGDGGAWILSKTVGYARAAELILTGEQIGADEALRLGLVNTVADDDKLMQDALALAERVAVNPPRAVRLAKRLLRESQHARLSDMLELSAAFQALAHETEDHKEAVDSFFEKRPPRFTGN